MDRIILASQSPRRKQLLEWARLKFDVLVSDANEDFPQEIPFHEVPVFIARNKAMAVQLKVGKDSIIIAADTIVVLNDRIIGKPVDREDAVHILKSLSGSRHEVITGVIIRKGDQEISFEDRTFVWFHPLSDNQIAFYVDEYKPFDKAGAYAIQEWIGVIGIKKIEGDFYNVMGMPVSRLMKELTPWLNSPSQ
ncbi:MAG: Maf family protein [Chitinophagales bacterium]